MKFNLFIRCHFDGNWYPVVTDNTSRAKFFADL